MRTLGAVAPYDVPRHFTLDVALLEVAATALGPPINQLIPARRLPTPAARRNADRHQLLDRPPPTHTKITIHHTYCSILGAASLPSSGPLATPRPRRP